MLTGFWKVRSALNEVKEWNLLVLGLALSFSAFEFVANNIGNFIEL